MDHRLACRYGSGHLRIPCNELVLSPPGVRACAAPCHTSCICGPGGRVRGSAHVCIRGTLGFPLERRNGCDLGHLHNGRGRETTLMMHSRRGWRTGQGSAGPIASCEGWSTQMEACFDHLRVKVSQPSGIRGGNGGGFLCFLPAHIQKLCVFGSKASRRSMRSPPKTVGEISSNQRPRGEIVPMDQSQPGRWCQRC